MIEVQYYSEILTAKTKYFNDLNTHYNISFNPLI